MTDCEISTLALILALIYAIWRAMKILRWFFASILVLVFFACTSTSTPSISNDPTPPTTAAPGSDGTDGASPVVSDGDAGSAATDPGDETPSDAGSGTTEVDTDGDGTVDSRDACPADANKIALGVCGCGVLDIDSDGDGTMDCTDVCPSDAAKIAAGVCGCGVADTDTDGDGTANCHDSCPSDAAKTAPGTCGCGVSDADTDSDSILDCNDNCPSASNSTQVDADADGIGDACDAPDCGNDVIETDETCDDGNEANGDGCSSVCRLECSPDFAFPTASTDIGTSLPSTYEPSGIIWHSRLRKLLLVSDGGTLTQMSTSGTSIVNRSISGDLEAITIADPSTDLIYIGVEQPSDSIIEFNLTTHDQRTFDVSAYMDVGSTDSNQGLEGLTFVPDPHSTQGGYFLTGRQQGGIVYVFELPIVSGSDINLITTFTPVSGRNDISDMMYDRARHKLYVIYDGDNKLVVMNTDWERDSDTNLPAESDGQEGFAVDGDCHVYITEDPSDHTDHVVRKY